MILLMRSIPGLSPPWRSLAGARRLQSFSCMVRLSSSSVTLKVALRRLQIRVAEQKLDCPVSRVNLLSLFDPWTSASVPRGSRRA